MYKGAEYQEAVYTAFRKHLPAFVPTIENPTDEGTTLQQRIILFPEVTDPSIIIRNLLVPAIKKLSDNGKETLKPITTLQQQLGTSVGPYLSTESNTEYRTKVNSSKKEIMNALNSTNQKIDREWTRTHSHSLQETKQTYVDAAYAIAFSLHLLPYYAQEDLSYSYSIYLQQLQELKNGFQTINTFVEEAQKLDSESK